MALCVITAAITVIVVCALIVIASCVDLPTVVRILSIVGAAFVEVVGIAAGAMLEMKAGYFECPHCKELFAPSMNEYVKGYHTLTKRRWTCLKCGKTGRCKHRMTR